MSQRPSWSGARRPTLFAWSAPPAQTQGGKPKNQARMRWPSLRLTGRRDGCGVRRARTPRAGRSPAWTVATRIAPSLSKPLPVGPVRRVPGGHGRSSSGGSSAFGRGHSTRRSRRLGHRMPVMTATACIPSEPVEGTLSQGGRAFELRRTRSLGQAKTRLPHSATAVAMNIDRLMNWLDETLQAQTRCSRFKALAV